MSDHLEFFFGNLIALHAEGRFAISAAVIVSLCALGVVLGIVRRHSEQE